jgi:SpoVK/Ycf46/Vps4 family AAA+-type ATPase
VVLAKGTPGFSGADLENLVNEAALLAAKRDKERLDMVDFEDSKDKVYMGLERQIQGHQGGRSTEPRPITKADMPWWPDSPRHRRG